MYDARILGKALMISDTIPNNYISHDIAAALVYIVYVTNHNTKTFPVCLNQSNKSAYE